MPEGRVPTGAAFLRSETHVGHYAIALPHAPNLSWQRNVSPCLGHQSERSGSSFSGLLAEAAIGVAALSAAKSSIGFIAYDHHRSRAAFVSAGKVRTQRRAGLPSWRDRAKSGRIIVAIAVTSQNPRAAVF